MSLFKWHLKGIPFEHHAPISKLAAACIKRSISDEQRKRFEDLEKEYQVENAMGAIGEDNYFIPVIEPDIPSDIQEVIIGCYCGVHQKYCEENGL